MIKRIKVAECGVGPNGERFYPGGYSYWDVEYADTGECIGVTPANNAPKFLEKTARGVWMGDHWMVTGCR